MFVLQPLGSLSALFKSHLPLKSAVKLCLYARPSRDHHTHTCTQFVGNMVVTHTK